MENVAFAGAALALIAVWTSPAPGWARLPVSAALLSVAMWLRPEGAILTVVVALDPPSRRERLAQAVVVIVVAFGTVLPGFVAHHAATGLWLPGSAVARVMAARTLADSFHLGGPVWLYLRAPLRVVEYAPLFACAALVARDARAEASEVACMLGMTILFALGMYTLVTGALHTARYLTWVFAAACALAPAALERLLASPRRADQLALVLGVALLAVAVVGESWLRREMSPPTAAEIVDAIARRRGNTDELLTAACAGGCCVPGASVGVAAVEVQSRLSYDERIRIVSLDGRASPVARPVAFDPGGCPTFDLQLSDPGTIGVAEPPLAQFPRCGGGPLARAMTAALRDGATPPDGWALDRRESLVYRLCKPTEGGGP
jgi:hypothetical protein